MAVLERLFSLTKLGTTVRREVLAGLTTFVGMAYIIFVNPAILADAGIDRGAAFTATCVAAAIGSALMGLLANYPIALAPGMGLNAYFSYTVVKGLGYSWEVALGAVFLSGIGFLLLSVLRVREAILNAIPAVLRTAISAGIGLFLGVIGLKNAGFVVDHPSTLVTLGDLTEPGPLFASVGFCAMVGMTARGIPGAILSSVLGVTVLAIVTGHVAPQGVVAAPPSLGPTFAALDIRGALDAGALAIVFTFLFVDLFDTAGTLIGVSHRAGLLDEDGKLKRARRALLADSTATIAGALLGTSTTTSYIESTLGIQAGGRSGLVAVVVAICFLACLVLSPLAATVPMYATAPALVFVACMMARGLSELDWDDPTEYAPAVVAALGMPLTFSIATGLGLGFCSYALIKLVAGRARDVELAVWPIAALFALKFALQGG